AGTGDGRADEARSRRDDRARRRVRHDSLEAGEHELPRLRDDPPEPRFRRLREELWRAWASRGVGGGTRAARARMLRDAGRACDRRADRLLRQRARAESRDQAAFGAALSAALSFLSGARRGVCCRCLLRQPIAIKENESCCRRVTRTTSLTL